MKRSHDASARQRLKAASQDALRRRGGNCGDVASTLKVLQDHDLLEDAVSKDSLRKSIRSDRAQWKQQYCSTVSIPLVDGTNFAWVVWSPAKALQYFLDRNPSLANLIAVRTPGTPLHLVFYHDEITPGNPLAPNNARKTVAIYMSCLEWKEALSSEFSWLPIAVLRSSVVKQSVGGLSGVLACFFRSLIPSFHGQSLRINDALEMVTFKWTTSIMDEKALMETWSAKGASGKKPCLLCVNCVSKPAGKILSDSSYFRDISHATIQDFQRTTDDDVWSAVDHLLAQHGILSKAAFLELQTNIGYTYNPTGLLYDQTLRNDIRPSSCCFDMLHCVWAVGGICAIETQYLVETLREENISWEALQSSMKMSVQSLHDTKPSARAKVLSEAHFNGTSGWKASGSEQMSVLPLLHFYLITHLLSSDLAARLEPKFDSFRLLCERLYYMTVLEKTGDPSFATLLKRAQEIHMVAYVKAYGREKTRPKHHYALHIPEQFQRIQCTLDTKTMERKHQALKRSIESAGQNLQKFEERMLHTLCETQSYEISKKPKEFWTYTLLAPRFCSAERWEADSFLAGCEVWKLGLIVVAADATWAGEIITYGQEGADIFLTVRVFECTHVLGIGVYEWKFSNTNKKIPWSRRTCYRPAYWKLTGPSLITFW